MKHTVTGHGANALLRVIAFGPDAPMVALSGDDTPLDRLVRDFTLTFERRMLDVTTFSDSAARFAPGPATVKVQMRVTQEPTFTDEPVRYTAQLPDGTFVTMEIYMESYTGSASVFDDMTWTVVGVVTNAADIMNGARSGGNLLSNVAAREAKGPPKTAPRPSVPKPDPPQPRGINISGDF